MTTIESDITATFLSAATAFADLVAGIADEEWELPALGIWDVRGLVGHTSRAISSVAGCFERPATEENVCGPADFYVALRRSNDRELLGETIAEGGRRTGAQLGADPASVIRTMVAQARTALDVCGDPLIATPVGGILLSNYLPTRSFELTVHSMDIARAIGADTEMPEGTISAAVMLAAEVSIALGLGSHVLAATIRRVPLPESFSIV